MSSTPASSGAVWGDEKASRKAGWNRHRNLILLRRCKPNVLARRSIKLPTAQFPRDAEKDHVARDDPDQDYEHDPVPRAEVEKCAHGVVAMVRRCIMCSSARRRG
jgi:hypothetical protein